MNGLALRQHRRTLTPEQTVRLVGLGVALSLLGDATMYVVLPTHTAEAGIRLADVGLMLSANRAVRIFLNGPAGVWFERLPRRPVLAIALAIGALSTLLYAIPGFWPLLAGRALWGLAWIGIWIGGSTVVLDVATDANRGRLVGRLQMWFFTGVGGCSLAGGALTDWLGYSATFLVGTALMAWFAAVWWLLLPETRPEQPESFTTSVSASSEQPLNRRSRAPIVTAVALLGLNWLIYLGVIAAIMPLLLKERIGSEVIMLGAAVPLATFTGALIAAQQVLGLTVAPAAGWLSDRTGNRWGLVVLALAVGIVAISAASVGAGAVVISAILCNAFTTSLLQTQIITVVGDYAGSRQGRFLGILNTAGDVGSMVGPPLAYALLPVIGMSGVLAAMALLLVVALPWAIWVAWQERIAR